MNAWTNLGDVNFAEHGGCQVRKAYSEESRREYPSLEECYEVFTMRPMSDTQVYAYLKRVDVSEYDAKAKEIESETDYVPCNDIEKVSMFANYIGAEPYVDTAYIMHDGYAGTDDFIIRPQEAEAWMKELGILQ